MFTTLIAQPLFNILVIIYALLPGHDLGVAIILFTILIRILLWPLVRKQLRNTKAMRDLQPELKRIKKEARGDKQKESAMLMELYKEKEINPFGSIGLLILQIPIFIGLYSGIQKVISNPHALVSFSYPFVQHLSWIQHLSTNISAFNHTLFGIVDLTKSAVGPHGIYWPAMVIVVASAVAQYYQSKQLMPTDDSARGLREIMRDAGQGKQAEQSEVSAAVGKLTRYFIPFFIFIVTVNIASALSLYWFTSSLIAYMQQAIVLRSDEEEMEALADKPGNNEIIEGEVIETKSKTTQKNPKKSTGKKRRKK